MGDWMTRRPSDVLLLVVNVVIVVVGVAVVWSKLRDHAGVTEPETPVLGAGTLPLPHREGVRGETGLSGTDLVDDTSREQRTRPAAADDAEPPRVTSDTPEAPETSPAAPPVRDELPPPPAATAAPREEQATEAPPAPAPSAPADARSVRSTAEAVDRIAADLEAIFAIRGSYPSSSIPFGANRGVEALHAELAKLRMTAGLRVGDTDGDARLEILDAWGRPLLYFSPDDYEATQRWAPGDAGSVELTACRIGSGGTYQAAGSFQLWSVGPDGASEGGCGDDVTSWTVRDASRRDAR